MLARFSGKIDGLQGPQAGGVGGGDLPVEQRLADAAAAVAVADVDGGLGDAGVDRPAGDGLGGGPADDPAVELGDPAVVGQPRRRRASRRSGTSVSKVALRVAMPSA